MQNLKMVPFMAKERKEGRKGGREGRHKREWGEEESKWQEVETSLGDWGTTGRTRKER